MLKGCHILTSLINWCSDPPGMTGGVSEKIRQGRSKLRGCFGIHPPGIDKTGVCYDPDYETIYASIRS